MLNKIALAALASAALMAPAAAAGNPGGAQSHVFTQRAQHQWTQLHQGMQAGQLTNAQFRALQQREDHISDQRSTMLQQDNGQLTSQQRMQLNAEQNNLSKQIYDTRQDDRARQDQAQDRHEQYQDQREQYRDNREQYRDNREQYRDKREQYRDKREQYRDERAQDRKQQQNQSGTPQKPPSF